MKTNNKDFEKMADNSFVLRFTIAADKIDKEWQHALSHAQQHFEAKGFRKGKAPLSVVEQNVSKTAILEDTASHLLSHEYEELVKKHDLHPIIQPQVKILNPPVDKGKDWEVEITGCELPNFSLDKKVYDEIKKINNQESKTDDKKSHKLDEVVEVMIKNSKVDLPNVLIEADIDHRISGLVDQINQAGLTVEQFLKDRKQTIEQYRDSLKEQVIKEWTINLGIDFIFKEQKMEVKPEEGKELIEKNPQLGQNINMVFYLLSQQKVFEYLQTLK